MRPLPPAGIRCEVVPGVTAALAASAELRIALTQRGLARSIALVTPRVGAGAAPSDWARSLVAADAGAIYMGAGEAQAIAAALIAAGKPASTPVAVVENASLPTARVTYTTLAGLPASVDSGATGPALILVGPQFRATAARRGDATAAPQRGAHRAAACRGPARPCRRERSRPAELQIGSR